MLGAIIYALCATSALLCTFLLFRAYSRSHYQLLLWGGLCFVGLSINNFLLVLDELDAAAGDLTIPRDVAALSAMLLLLYGLIWHAE